MISLTRDRLLQFQELGYLLLGQIFSKNELNLIKTEILVILEADSPGKVLESDGRTIRAVHGGELYQNRIFQKLLRLPKLMKTAIDILGSQVYSHQYKITFKSAFKGDVWQWHQDFQYWFQKDGMPKDRAVNIVLFLDDVNEFNGPLMLIPSSHQEGIIKVKTEDNHSGWRSHMSSQLEDTTDPHKLKQLVQKYGIVAPKGEAGSVLCFHPNCVHGSGINMSPFDRRLLMITYNSVENQLRAMPNPRPDFLANRDFTPLQMLQEDTLLGDREVVR